VNLVKPLSIAMLLLMLLSTVHAQRPAKEEAVLAKPSPKQIRFADWEVGAFIHFGLNVFTGQEHGDGKEPPSKFNPTELDAEQWVITAKSMGARYACLTARHEGGFCLWPSTTTDYTIANSRYMDGKGDIVRDFVGACRKHGLEPALYLTASHDAHTALYGHEGHIGWGAERDKWVEEAFKNTSRQAYFKEVQVAQMRELLTNYGPISFMWSDHWDATDPNGPWRAVTLLVEELQPDMVFMGTETWVPGNETGHVVYPMWNAVHTVDGTRYARPAATAADVSFENDYGLLETDVRTGHPLGRFWRVRECTTNTAFHYGGWFWHPSKLRPTRPRSLWDHVDLYYRTVGLGANTVINLPPDQRGLIPDDFVAAAKAFGDEIRGRFSNPVAELADPPAGDVVELAWDEATEINTIVTMEHIANGQKIARYTLEAFVDGAWQTLAPMNRHNAWTPYNPNPGYETIGHKKIDRIMPVHTSRIRFRCLEAVRHPIELRQLTVFHCPPKKRAFPANYPYLSGVDTLVESAHGAVGRDVNCVGNRLSLNGKTHAHGLLMHPDAVTKTSVVQFDLTHHPKAKGIRAIIGIDDYVGDNGSSVFLVEGLRNGEWQELYRSHRLTGRHKGVLVRVTFPPGMEQVRLTTTDAGDGVNCDHAVWAQARFTE